MRSEHSAGAVVYTLCEGQPYYVLIQELSGHTGLPKGHLEVGETPAQAAVREIWEETAIHAVLTTGEPLFTERYALRSGGEKQVDYFIAYYEAQTPAGDPKEVARVMLLPLEKALAALSHESGRGILRQADEIIRKTR